MKKMRISILFSALCLSLSVCGQDIFSEMSAPVESLINEEVCFSLTLSNTGVPGYQPYIRLLLPPSTPASGLLIKMFDETITNVQIEGIVSGGTVLDPNLSDELPESVVNGQEGYQLVLVNLPVGSMVENGIELEISGCVQLNGPSVQVGTPVVIYAQPVYRFGDEPTGVNGPLVYDELSVSIVPSLYTLSKEIDQIDYPTGSCWNMMYSLKVNIAEGELVTDLVVTDLLPPELQYITVIGVTPGCVVQQQPSTTNPGGTLTVKCDNAFGTPDSDDVLVSFLAFITDQLDPTSCDSVIVQNNASLASNEGSTLIAQSPATGHHFIAGSNESSADVWPGMVVPYEVKYKVSEYIDGIDAAVLSIRICDGMMPMGNEMLNGVPISPFSVAGPTAGEYEYNYNLIVSNGAPFAPCEEGSFIMDVMVLENYDDGDPVSSTDILPLTAAMNYDIANGSAACFKTMNASYSIPSAEVIKEIVSSPNNGEGYVPGETVDYRLTMVIPSGDARDIVFEDIFPIPIHDVATLDLTFGNDIVLSPLDNIGLTPQSISIDTDLNMLSIEWGDLSIINPSEAAVISVDISAVITAEPFANGLTHSNFGRFKFNNTVASASNFLDLVAIEVGAPSLDIRKGVAATSNPNAVLNPIQIPVNANVTNVDANDILTYQITLRNLGDAPAYDAIVVDIPPADYLENCTLVSVQNEFEVDKIFAGSLFTAGLVVEEIDRAGSVDGSWAVIKYTCEIKSDIESVDNFMNESEVTWAASPGNPDRFEPIYDAALGSTPQPIIEKTILDVEPGYTNSADVHIGELISYRADLTIIEGITKTMSFEDILEPGLSIESLDSLVIPFGVTFAAGSNSEVWNNALVEHLGPDPIDQRRKLSLNFENATNVGNNNFVPETISVYYKAVALNSADNQNGQILDNEAKIKYVRGNSGGVVNVVATASCTIVEPDILLDLDWFNTDLNPGEETFVTVSVKHSATSTADAHDVAFTFDLPIGLELVDGSFSVECDELFEVMPTEEFGQIMAKWDRLPLDLECDFVFTVKVSDSYPPCTFLDHCANVSWRSINDDDEASMGLVPMNELSVPRTGSTADIGDDLNVYTDSECGALEIISEAMVTPTLTGPQQACSGSEVILTIPEYDGFGVIYHWTGPGVPAGYNNNELVLEALSTGDEGVYTVYVEVGDCETDLSNTIDLVLNGNPIVELEDLDLPCTSGTDDVTLTPNISGGDQPFDYFWSGPDYNSSDQVATIPNAGVDDEGVYSLYIIDDNGCISNTSTSVLAVTNAPSTPEIEGTLVACEGADLVFTCTNYLGDVTYHWITPNGEETTVNSQYTIESAGGLADGLYSVWVSVNECSTETSNLLNVEVVSTPETPQIEASATQICAGSTLVFSGPSGADTYTWSGPNGYTSSQASPPIVDNITNFESGTYTLIITNSGCASEMGSIEVDVIPQPATPSLISNSPICVGQDLLFITDDDALEYVWEAPGGSQYTTSEGEFIITNSLPTDGGEYNLIVFDGMCYSASSLATYAAVDVIPSVQAAGGSDVFACDGAEAWIFASNDEAYSGFWTTSADELTVISPQSTESSVIGATNGNSYVLTWSLFNDGCGVYSTDDIILYSPEDPTAEIDRLELGQGEAVDIFVLVNDWHDQQLVTVNIVEEPMHGSADVGLNEYVDYRADEDYFGTDDFVYEICLDECPNMCDTAHVKLLIRPYLEIPDVITPNGDGANDTFFITGLENFPNNELYIYNRWGREVFGTANYQNDWEGLWQGQTLPEGTYYYVFKETDTRTSVQQGYIVLHR
ncbi:MAG: gliding motility-associated-like protein/uncharacterized repeat protein (TIGR01451 family) [Litorivivens sp.]|jgi:gliding motility-associated-like protein/uncharacterized repeat protein (TIGR01451 family)/fimbrial isopeptide formation D2 family protein